MKCPNCNSENVQVQSKECKPKLTIPILLMCGGFGLMFLGGVGFIIGLIIGLVVAAIVKSVLPQRYQPVIVCQQCGFVGTSQTIAQTGYNNLFCTPDESNLIVIRKSNGTGAVCAMRVSVDEFAPFEVNNGDLKHLRLESGVHKINYCQVNGLGKKGRTGSVDVTIDGEKRLVQFEFKSHGINVIVQ